MEERFLKFNRTAAGIIADGLFHFGSGDLDFFLLSCQYNELPPDLRIPEHEHPHYVLTFVETSYMETTCDDLILKTYPNTNRLFFMPPAISHHCRFGESGPHRNFTINFQIGGPHALEVNERIAHHSRELRYEIPLTPETDSLLRMLLHAGESEAPLTSELLKHLLAAFLTTLMRQTFPDALENLSDRETLRMVFRHDRVDAIKRAMWAMVRDPNPVTILSKSFELSSRHLNRLFRKETGRSIKQYQNELRIRSACNLLQNSNLSISAVGEALGFHRPGLFAAFFRKHLACTPLEYRIRSTRSKITTQ